MAISVQQITDHALLASGRHGWQKADLKLRRADTDLETLKKTLERNGRDEIVVQTQDGTLYVVDAVSLKLESGNSPEIGDRFVLAGSDADVVHVDVDPERWAGVLTMGGALLGAPLVVKAVMIAANLPPEAGLIATGIAIVAGFVGGAVVAHPRPNDAALSEVSTTLASSKKGDFHELEAELGDKR